jgi:hypothetical protein
VIPSRNANAFRLGKAPSREIMNSDKQAALESGHSDTAHPIKQIIKKKPGPEKDNALPDPQRFELRAVAPLDPDF